MSGAGRGGAPRRTRAVGPTHTKDRTEIPCIVVALFFCTCTTSLNALIHCVENVSAVAGKRWGQRQALGYVLENLALMSPRRKPCACQFGNWAKLASLAPAATTVHLPDWCFFNVRHFDKLGGRQPPTAVAGRGACQVRGGAGPRAKHGVPSRCPKNKGGVGLSTPRLFFLGGPAGLKLRVEFLLEFATCTTSQNVLIPYVENVLAVAGGKSWGSAGPTSRGVIQRGNTLGVLS